MTTKLVQRAGDVLSAPNLNYAHQVIARGWSMETVIIEAEAEVNVDTEAGTEIGDERASAETAEQEASATPLALQEKYPHDEPLTALDARDLQSLFQAAYEWLAHNYEMVNRLNVFPVPDGDTGTNMLLTIKSAWANIANRAHDTVSAVAEAAAEGAHHGSRGNSGVILGQILQGFSQGLREKATLNTHDLAEALR
jgi:hypothetical protein